MTILPPALGPEAYIDPDWFEKEKARVFRPLWQFFALAGALDKPNSFVARTLFDVPVVLQNCGGDLRAFENICLHRQAPLQMQPEGCRPLTCPYHGWHYDADGKVAAIPHAEFYQFPPDALAKMQLRRFAVARLGNLVFVNLDEKPMPIERQFTPELIADLTALSSHFDSVTTVTKVQRAFNWKLIFENLRDGLHPLFIHRDSLYKEVKFQPALMPADVLRDYVKERERGGAPADEMAEAREFFSRGGPDRPFENFHSAPWHANVARYGKQDWYYNWLLFPNLHIASASGGHSFTVEHYVPVAADKTQIEITYVTAKRTHAAVSLDNDLKAARMAMVAGAIEVLEEDFAMLEAIQRGLHAGATRGQWGAYELRNHRVASWIGRRVGGG